MSLHQSFDAIKHSFRSLPFRYHLLAFYHFLFVISSLLGQRNHIHRRWLKAQFLIYVFSHDLPANRVLPLHHYLFYFTMKQSWCNCCFLSFHYYNKTMAHAVLPLQQLPIQICR